MKVKELICPAEHEANGGRPLSEDRMKKMLSERRRSDENLESFSSSHKRPSVVCGRSTNKRLSRLRIRYYQDLAVWSGPLKSFSRNPTLEVSAVFGVVGLGWSRQERRQSRNKYSQEKVENERKKVSGQFQSSGDYLGHWATGPLGHNSNICT